MLKRFLPLLRWLPNYKKIYLSGDIYAGITVGIMLIPQGMAYALIAGLPPVYGLYAAIVPQIVYTLLGTSRHLAVGPVAMDSLLVAAGLGTLSISSPEEYIAMAITLAFLVGIIQIVLGLLRMGFFVTFLSKPVVSGFTTAAAFIIGGSQLQHLLGIQVHSNSRFDVLLWEIFQKIGSTNFMAFSIGICAVIILYAFRKKASKIPLGLLVVFLGILVVTLTQWDERGLAVVGEIPQGLPKLKLPILTYEKLSQLFPVAITLALISIMEAMAISKSFENKTENHKINADQELVALGSANMIGSFFQAYPISGGFSRTAVNEQAGAKTAISGLIGALVVAVVLLFFTTLFFKLPKSILAAIIMVAVLKLIDLRYPIRLFKTRKDEFILLILTFLVTLFLGIKEGLLVGILFSFLLLVYRTSKPHFAFLAKIKKTNYYKNIERFPNETVEREDLIILRFDAQLFFGNIDYFRNIIFEKINIQENKVRGFILSAESINYIDSTAVEQLIEISKSLKSNSVRFMIAGAIGPARDIIFSSKIIQNIGRNNLFVNTKAAVKEFDSILKNSNIRIKVTEQNNSN